VEEEPLPISEPMTVLTDYLLAGVAAALAYRLHRANRSRAATLWALTFAATALAALVGGSVHGLVPRPPRVFYLLRTATVMSVGAGTACLLAGVVFATVGPGSLRRVLLALCALKLALYLAWVARHPEFRYAAYDSAPVGLLVLAFLIRWWLGSRSRAAGLGVAGMLLSIVGLVLQQSRFGIHDTWFNHNDLYHAVQAAALWLVQRAGLGLRDAA